MDIKTLVPIDFSRKITPFVVGDTLLSNTNNGYNFTVTSQRLVFFNSEKSNGSNYFVISYADRPNTGKQPVGDDVVVDVTIESGKEIASADPTSYSWLLTLGDAAIDTWKPNHAAMVEAYQSSLADKEDDRMNNFNFSDVLVKRDGGQIDKPLSFSNDAPEVFINLPEDVIIGRPTNYSPTSNDLELGRLVDFVFSNKLILDGENPVDCAIRELAEKHDIDTRSDEDKLRDAIDLAIDDANLGLDNIDRGLITVALLASNNLNITTKGK